MKYINKYNESFMGWVKKDKKVDTRKTDAEKEYWVNYRNFYSKITENDIIDLLVDISDVLGTPYVDKNTINDNHGYIIKYENSLTYYPGKAGNYYSPTDKMVTLINDLNVLYKRIISMYKLDMGFEFVDNELQIVIFENIKKG